MTKRESLLHSLECAEHAKKHVETNLISIHNEIAGYEKELKDLDTPKVGQRYKRIGGHYGGHEYVLARVDGMCSLIDINIGIAWSSPRDNIEDVFGSAGRYTFELLS